MAHVNRLPWRLELAAGLEGSRRDSLAFDLDGDCGIYNVGTLTVTASTLSGNSANEGGGVAGCVLNNCILTGNSGTVSGGALFQCTAMNCVLTGNNGGAGSNAINPVPEPGTIALMGLGMAALGLYGRSRRS